MTKPIEVDCETTGLQPWSRKQEPFLFTFFDGEESEALFLHKDRERIQAWLNRAYEDNRGLRAWNTKFDRAFAEVAGFDLPPDGYWHDGMLEAHAIDERRSVALKAVGTQLFGEGTDDLQKQVHGWLNEERKRRSKEAAAAKRKMEYPNFSDVPDEIMVPYALEDVLLTRKVCDTYEPMLAAASDLAGVVEFERKTMDALYAIERRGLPARREDYRKLEIEVANNLEALEERVQELAKEAGIDEYNPNSSQQTIAVLKARGADLSHMSEVKGKLSADADNLRTVDDELAVALLDYRSEAKVLTTYVRPMIGRTYETRLDAYKEPFVAEDSRIHTNYRQVGARTGRMSSADPNVQNQPRDDLRLRYNIVADEGYKLVTCDLSNIEMVLFAAYAGEGKLLDAVRNGEDLHVLTARMLGLRDRKRPGGGIETARQLGKTYNFSRIYGGGLRTIRRSFRCSMDEARLLKKRFDQAYPETKRLQDLIAYRLEDQGYIQDKMISGRRFRVDPREAYKATNYLVQGTAASLLKQSVQALHADGVPMIGLVHDEVIAHVPAEDAEEAKHLIIERLTDHPTVTEYVPLAADGAVVDRWSDAKPLQEKDNNGNPIGAPYLFTPEWDGGERREVYYT